MKYREAPIQCSFCGRFLKVDGSIVCWTSFGGQMDLEPPDEEFAHQDCWDKQTDGGSLVRRTSWMGPQRIDGELI